MSQLFRSLLTLALVLAVPAASLAASNAKKKKAAADPAAPATASAPAHKDYLGAIVIDAADGKVLFEDNADVTAYPASVTKLMNLLLVVEHIEAGKVHLNDKIVVTADVAKMGGTQVFLKQGEVFTVEEYLYAMMIQSANDAALALAKHVGGEREPFVALMNERAAQLGMTHTHFVTPHGLASPGQQADTSSPRDIATLARAVAKHPLALRFTSTKERTFRQTPLTVMRNHNKLLWQVAGCDGLKTGYLARAGYSLAATQYRDGKRIIAVVMGSKGVYGRVRDGIARDLMATALLKASPLPADWKPAEIEEAPAVPLGAPGSTPAEEESDEANGVHFHLPGAPAGNGSAGTGK